MLATTFGLPQHRSTDDLAKLHRIVRVFLASLLIVAGTEAPTALRQIADEFEWREAERVSE